MFRKYLAMIVLAAFVCGTLFAQKPGRRTPAPKDKGSEALIDAGEKLADDRKWNEAIDAYLLATRVDPQNADAYVGLGNAYMGAGKWTEALAAYNKAVALDPQSADAQYALGDAYNTMRMHGDAFGPLVKAIQLDPTFAEAYSGIGYAYLSGKQYEKSLSFLGSATRLKPDYEDAHYGLAVAYLNLGNQKGLDDERKRLVALKSDLVKKLDSDIAKFEPPLSAVLPSSVASADQSAKKKAAAPNDPNSFELAFWESIKNSKDPEDFNYYLRKYPDGKFAALARIRTGQSNSTPPTIVAGVAPMPRVAPDQNGLGQRPELAIQAPQTVGLRTVGQQKPELYVQKGHSGRVQALAFSADGRMLASGSDDLTIRFWEVATGKELKTLVGHTANVIFLAFSPDGKRLVSAAKGQEAITLWDVSTGKELGAIEGVRGDVYQLQFSPDGKLLVSGSYDGVIKMWDLATGKELRTFAEGGSSIRSLAFSADGELLASGDVLGFVEVWTVSTGKKVKTLQGTDATPVALKMREDLNVANTKFMDSVDAVVFDREGKTLTTVAANAIRRFEITSGKLLAEISRDNKYGIRQMAATPTKASVAYAERGYADIAPLPVRVLDLTSGKTLSTFMAEEEVESVALSGDGQILACSSVHAGTITLVDAGTGKQIRTLKGHTLDISVLAVSDAGNVIAVGEQQGYIQLWNTSLGDVKPLTEGDSFTDGNLVSLAWSKDGKSLAAGTSKQTIKLWDVESSRLIATLKNSQTPTGAVDDNFLVAFAPDNKTLMSVESQKKLNVVRSWDIESGKELKAVTFEASRNRSRISPDTSALAVIDDDDVGLWDLQTGKQIQSLKGHSTEVTHLAFSADSKTIATVSEDSAKVWEVETGKELRTLKGLSLAFVAFSDDGRLLTADRQGKAIRLWDVRTGNELTTISLNNDLVVPLKLGADGAALVGISLSGSVTLFDVKSGKTLASFVALDERDWVAFTPDGRFDGSPDGIKLLHYVQDNKAIPLDSVLEQFYTPKLLQRVLAREATPSGRN
jgi:WD40 repeat protein